MKHYAQKPKQKEGTMKSMLRKIVVAILVMGFGTCAWAADDKKTKPAPEKPVKDPVAPNEPPPPGKPNFPKRPPGEWRPIAPATPPQK